MVRAVRKVGARVSQALVVDLQQQAHTVVQEQDDIEHLRLME